jgi:ribosome-binding protein aMBF1 (putative translation factor)
VGTIITKTDDLTGQTIPGTVVTLAVDGSEMEVSENTAVAFRAMLAGDLAAFTEYAKPYVKKTTKTTAGGQLDMTEVRTWAKANGFDVKDRGKVPADVIEKYRLSLAS